MEGDHSRLQLPVALVVHAFESAGAAPSEDDGKWAAASRRGLVMFLQWLERYFDVARTVVGPLTSRDFHKISRQFPGKPLDSSSFLWRTIAGLEIVRRYWDQCDFGGVVSELRSNRSKLQERIGNLLPVMPEILEVAYGWPEFATLHPGDSVDIPWARDAMPAPPGSPRAQLLGLPFTWAEQLYALLQARSVGRLLQTGDVDSSLPPRLPAYHDWESALLDAHSAEILGPNVPRTRLGVCCWARAALAPHRPHELWYLGRNWQEQPGSTPRQLFETMIGRRSSYHYEDSVALYELRHATMRRLSAPTEALDQTERQMHEIRAFYDGLGSVTGPTPRLPNNTRKKR